MRYIATIEDKEHVIDVEQGQEIVIDGTPHAVDFVHLEGRTLVSLLLEQSSYEALVEERDGTYQVLLHGKLYTVQVEDERARRLKKAASGAASESGELTLKAPMPGLIVGIQVEDGQEIQAGQVVAILESMKMQNPLKAPRTGVIGRVRVQIGQSVEQGQALLTIT